MQAIAQVIFNSAPLIAQYLAGVLTGPLAAIALAAQATQIVIVGVIDGVTVGVIVIEGVTVGVIVLVTVTVCVGVFVGDCVGVLVGEGE